MIVKNIVESNILKKIILEDINEEDICDKKIIINIPSIIDGEQINSIGVTNKNLIEIDRNLPSNLTLDINLEEGPVTIFNIKPSNPENYIINLSISKSIKYIGNHACSGLNINKMALENTSIIKFGPNSFLECEFHQKFNIPKTCIMIENSAFYGAKFFKGIDFKKSNIELISENAFKEAILNIDKLVLPNSLKDLKAFAFKNCKNINTLLIESDSKIAKIGDNCFHNCKNLKSFDISETKTKVIPTNFCYANSVLANIKLPNTVETIKEFAFAKCGLTQLVLPQKLKKIGKKAFYSNFISNINFNDSLKKISIIDTESFANNKLHTLPQDIFVNLKGVGPYAFSHNEFQELTLFAPQDSEVLKGAVFANNINLKKVTLANSTHEWKKISSRMFLDCIRLEEINLPETIYELRAYCLYNTNFSSIKLTNISLIDEYAIGCCKNLAVIDLSDCPSIEIKEKAFAISPATKILKLSSFISNVSPNSFYGLPENVIDKALENCPFAL